MLTITRLFLARSSAGGDSAYGRGFCGGLALRFALSTASCTLPKVFLASLYLLDGALHLERWIAITPASSWRFPSPLLDRAVHSIIPFSHLRGFNLCGFDEGAGAHFQRLDQRG